MPVSEDTKSSPYITFEQWEKYAPKIIEYLKKAYREIKGKFMIDPKTDKLVRIEEGRRKGGR